MQYKQLAQAATLMTQGTRPDPDYSALRADSDSPGVFAQLEGALELLSGSCRARVRSFALQTLMDQHWFVAVALRLAKKCA